MMRATVGQSSPKHKPDAADEVTISNPQGLHARPIMRFVDLAARFRSRIRVCNVTRGGEPLDGKSAFEMMLLEATHGNVLRIEAQGVDAAATVDALVELVETTLASEPNEPASRDTPTS